MPIGGLSQQPDVPGEENGSGGMGGFSPACPDAGDSGQCACVVTGNRGLIVCVDGGSMSLDAGDANVAE